MTVDISSSDVDLLIMAQAVLAFVGEDCKPDVEYAARLSAAESVLQRLARDAMLESAIAKTFLAKESA